MILSLRFRLVNRRRSNTVLVAGGKLPSCVGRMLRSGVGDCGSQPRAGREFPASSLLSLGLAPVGISGVVVTGNTTPAGGFDTPARRGNGRGPRGAVRLDCPMTNVQCPMAEGTR